MYGVCTSFVQYATSLASNPSTTHPRAGYVLRIYLRTQPAKQTRPLPPPEPSPPIPIHPDLLLPTRHHRASAFRIPPSAGPPRVKNYYVAAGRGKSCRVAIRGRGVRSSRPRLRGWHVCDAADRWRTTASPRVRASEPRGGAERRLRAPVHVRAPALLAGAEVRACRIRRQQQRQHTYDGRMFSAPVGA